MENNNPNGTGDIEQATPEEIDALRAKAKEAEDVSKKYKELQAEFTRRNQTKSRGEQPQQNEQDDGIAGANEYLKTHGSKVLKEELGFVSKDDFENLLEERLNKIREVEKLERFPQLAHQKDAILQLSRHDGLSIEETIKKYKFLNDDTMAEFNNPTVGTRKKTPGTINLDNPTAEDLAMIKNMSSEEYTKFMKRQ